MRVEDKLLGDNEDFNRPPYLSEAGMLSCHLQEGSVLELVPVEPAEGTEMPKDSPVLSSPAHELVRS